MAQQLTVEDAKESLAGHVATKGAELQAKYGPHIGWSQLQAILQDRTLVRYPVEIVFDAKNLLAGEFAHPLPKSDDPAAGFILYIHPIYSLDLERVPYLVLYELVLVNYGEFASPDDAELFGASALGLSTDDYYLALCELADQLPDRPIAEDL